MIHLGDHRSVTASDESTTTPSTTDVQPSEHVLRGCLVRACSMHCFQRSIADAEAWVKGLAAAIDEETLDTC